MYMTSFVLFFKTAFVMNILGPPYPEIATSTAIILSVEYPSSTRQLNSIAFNSQWEKIKLGRLNWIQFDPHDTKYNFIPLTWTQHSRTSPSEESSVSGDKIFLRLVLGWHASIVCLAAEKLPDCAPAGVAPSLSSRFLILLFCCTTILAFVLGRRNWQSLVLGG